MTRRGARVVSLLAVVALATSACGGGGDSADTAAPDATEPATTEASTTDAPTTESPATDAPTTDPPATEPPATDPPATEAPTTTAAPLPTFTSQELADALPTIDAIGEPWVVAPEAADTLLDPTAASGPGRGSCGGDNGAARAESLGRTGAVIGPLFVQTGRHGVSVTVYSFPTEDAASQYIVGSTAANTCEPVVYDIAEGDGPDQYAGFQDGFGAGTTWNISIAYTAEETTVDFADEALITSTETTRSNVMDGYEFGEVDTDLYLYTRHGSLVAVTVLRGRCCSVGYLNVDQIPEYTPTEPELVDLARALTTALRENLGVA